MLVEKLALLFAVVAITCVGAATAGHAQNNRTFVSNTGVSGNTALGCSAASPCDTFAHALSVTNAGGEINCLNAGEFGPVTITQEVTINCESTSNGGITTSGANAIVVNTAGSVSLIGLDINGMNVAGGNGVAIVSSGSVNIRNCKIHGFLANETDTGFAIVSMPLSSGGNLVVDKVLLAYNSAGVGLLAVSSGASVNMTVRNSDINNNVAYGIVVDVANGGTHAGATIEQTTLAFNGAAGLLASGAGAIAVLGSAAVVNNGAGIAAARGGIIYSFKNNQIGGNGTDGTPLTAYPGGPLN